MELDNSSKNVNVEKNSSNRRFNSINKRKLSPNTSQNTSEQRKKFQKINNVQNDVIYDETILEDGLPDYQCDVVSDDDFSSEAANFF